MYLYDNKSNKKLIEDIKRISKVHYSGYINYLKKYYLQTAEISSQNKKVRKDFQKAEELSFINKLKLYKNANIQDVKNRVAGLIINLIK